MIRFLSVCSGIEAASVAWEPLGWKAAAFSEVEPAPRAVLRHHWPEVPIHGRDRLPGETFEDHAAAAGFQTIEGTEYGPTDLLVGGTPCQDNSAGYSAGAGRAGDGLSGPRSGLAFEFARLADRAGVRWVLWENVPNVLCGRHAPGFLQFVDALVQLGFGCAWRVLDGRGFGIADQPRRRIILVGYRGSAASAGAVLFERQGDRRHSRPQAEAAPVLTARGGMAFDDRTPCILEPDGRARIATPREWERAMGFPDDHTLVPYRGRLMANGPRFKMLGNSMPVQMMRWLGERIQAVDEQLLTDRLDAAA